jgi:hypothetical protein
VLECGVVIAKFNSSVAEQRVGFGKTGVNRERGLGESLAGVEIVFGVVDPGEAEKGLETFRIEPERSLIGPLGPGIQRRIQGFARILHQRVAEPDPGGGIRVAFSSCFPKSRDAVGQSAVATGDQDR